MSQDQQTSAAVGRMGELYGGLYLYLAKEMLDTFGAEGDKALRRAIRKFGKDRGVAMRKKHEEAGIPICVESLRKHPDMPYGSMLSTKNIELRPDFSLSHTLQCPLFDAWKDAGGEKVGLIYCEEIHEAMWGSYDEKVKVEQPTIMTRGDEYCTFRLSMDK